MMFEIARDDRFGCTLIMNGEILLECVEEDELLKLTVADILNLIDELDAVRE